MIRVVLIGCGAIGRRHLEACLSVDAVDEVHVVEPRVDVRPTIDGTVPVLWHDDLTAAASSIDGATLLISAVTADRQPVVAAQLSGMRPKAILIEKPVAQSMGMMEAVRVALEDSIEIDRAYVNCVRSTFPGWHLLRRELFSRNAPFHMQVKGHSWGYACNTVHFIDVFRFLSGSDDIRCTAVALETVAGASKRGPEFEEFTGMANFRGSSGDTLTVDCQPGHSDDGLVINIREKGSEHVLFIVSERTSRVHDVRDGTVSDLGFLPVSRTTAEILEALVDGEDPGVPTLEDAMISHRALYASLAAATGRQHHRIT